MFDLDQFIADCRVALSDEPSKSVREVVRRAVSDPAAIIMRLGDPKRAGLHSLYRSDDLTILNVVWAPMMTVVPHNHRMWAVIGIYTGARTTFFGAASRVARARSKPPAPKRSARRMSLHSDPTLSIR